MIFFIFKKLFLILIYQNDPKYINYIKFFKKIKNLNFWRIPKRTLTLLQELNYKC